MSERSVADGAQMPAPASYERPEDGLGGQLTVVLLTFNCAHRIAGVLARLEALHVPVVVVDNGSGDDIRVGLPAASRPCAAVIDQVLACLAAANLIEPASALAALELTLEVHQRLTRLGPVPPEARGVQPGTPSRRLTGIFAGFALAAHGR